MNPYPIAKRCPSCGSSSFKRVRAEQGRITFNGDRKCQECGTRYTPPVPTWAAILTIIAGCSFVAFILSIIVVARLTAASRGPITAEQVRSGWLLLLLTLPGITVAAVGVRLLLKRPPETKSPLPEKTKPEPRRAGPPDDRFSGRAPVNERRL
jgi:hypothetical protein